MTDHPIDLESAYQQAEAATRSHSKSFYLATSLLPKADRRAVRALYGFCRTTDNIVDDPQTVPGTDLATWRAMVNSGAEQQHNNPLLLAWADTRRRYHVPDGYANELIDGCEMDLTQTRYETFAELEKYCYCVASTVGLMAMHIFGTTTNIDYEDAKPYAIKLGIALQLTNILRDVGEDAHRRGRIYLPLEDLARFDVSEDDILCGRLNRPVIRLLQFEIERAHHLYEEAWPGIGFLAKKARFFGGRRVRSVPGYPGQDHREQLRRVHETRLFDPLRENPAVARHLGPHAALSNTVIAT